MTARSLFHALLAVLCAALICACGGGGGLPGNAVAEVGSMPIARATLDHWMQSLVGDDYFVHKGMKAPRGLVSDPPNYNRCVSAAGRVVPKSADGDPVMTREQLAVSCRQLYQALEQQALSLLITFAWRSREAVEQGVNPSTAEVKRLAREQFPQQGEFQTYIHERDWTASDELLELGQEIMSTRLVARFKRQHAGSSWRRELAVHYAADVKKWTAITSCRAGYVVPECSEYRGPATSSGTSPAVILENLSAGR